MKKSRFIALLLALAMMFSLCATAAAADEGELTENIVVFPKGDSVNNIGGNVPVCFSPGDQLGRPDWPSFSMARNYYGTDFSYYRCAGGGSPYTFYYCFDDGSKMFFGVRGEYY